jgi:hypothetical protein
MEKLNLPYIFAVAGKKRRRRQIHDTRNLGWRDTIRTRSTSSGLRRVDGGRGEASSDGGDEGLWLRRPRGDREERVAHALFKKTVSNMLLVKSLLAKL